MVGETALKEWERFVKKMAKKKRLPPEKAAIHAAPAFYFTHDAMPGDLKR